MECCADQARGSSFEGVNEVYDFQFNGPRQVAGLDGLFMVVHWVHWMNFGRKTPVQTPSLVLPQPLRGQWKDRKWQEVLPQHLAWVCRP